VLVERWKGHLKPDDVEIYKRDGYRVRSYVPDVAEWAPAGLASFRPVLEPADAAGPAAVQARPARSGPSFAIRIACPSEAVREEWGDYHFARSLSEALLRLGCRSRIDYLQSCPDPGDDCDVDLVLRGLERFRTRPARLSLIWVISHPDRVGLEELREHDHVFVASETLAQRWSADAGIPLEPLLQCTDPALFFPDPADRPRNRDILFVGNSRNVFRPAVRAVIEAGLAPAVYGTRWEPLIDPAYIRSTVIPNAAVGELYRTAGLVLNDHWPDMRSADMLSNRVFDALACGAPVVSDEIAGLPEGFSEFLDVFGPGRPIAQAIANVIDENKGRRAARRAFAETVRREHSFDRRAEAILDRAKALLATRRKAQF
jgi:glycosyltransferase involved in cell wall biosynthesis